MRVSTSVDQHISAARVCYKSKLAQVAAVIIGNLLLLYIVPCSFLDCIIWSQERSVFYLSDVSINTIFVSCTIK